MFLNSLEQLFRRKILLVATLAALAFILLFWLSISKAVASIDFQSSQAPGPAEAAMLAVFSAGAVASTLLTALVILLSVSILPDEISHGRMSFWAALPIPRLSLYLGTTLPALACSYALALFLFAGVLGVTSVYLDFTPTSVPLAFLCLAMWLGVIWAAVTTLSLLLKKIPSMLLAFALCGMAGFSGGVVQVAGVVPNAETHGFVKVAQALRYVFPSDTAFRGLLYGLAPRESVVTEGLAFIGVTSTPGSWDIVYPVLWILAIVGLGYWYFARIDLP